jgi:opacity protein-like surface antigen
MKKFFTAMVMAAAFMTVVPTQAQVKFGLKGGLNVTNMSMDSKVFDASNRTGFFVGPTVLVNLPIVGLGIDASALYDQRDAKLKTTEGGYDVDKTLSQKSVMIPINVRYGIGLGTLASVYAFAGPQFGFNVGNKDQTLVENVAGWRLKDSNFSINVGLGAIIADHLQISANYNIACGTTGEATVANATSALASELIGSTKTNAWQIALAYYF